MKQKGRRTQGSVAPHMGMVISFALVCASAADVPPTPETQPGVAAEAAFVLELPASSIWKEGVGEGYRSSAQSLNFEAGAAYGPTMLGSKSHHHLALASLSYGHMVGPVLAEGHWWRGNFELRMEVFGGMQFSPEDEWLVGLTPHVRYNFATGTSWIPFIDGGIGVVLTGIGEPDLGSTFEFCEQACAGVHWYLRDNLALTAEARFIHISNAGISEPNFGLNAWIGMVGLTWFF